MEEPDTNEAKDKNEADEKSELESKVKQTKFVSYMIIGIWISMTTMTFYYLGNNWISWVSAIFNTLFCGAFILAQKKRLARGPRKRMSHGMVRIRLGTLERVVVAF